MTTIFGTACGRSMGVPRPGLMPSEVNAQERETASCEPNSPGNDRYTDSCNSEESDFRTAAEPSCCQAA